MVALLHLYSCLLRMVALLHCWLLAVAGSNVRWLTLGSVHVRDDSGQVYSIGNSGHRDIRLSAKLEAGITSLHTNLYGDVSSVSLAMGSYILGWLRLIDII